MTSNIVIEGIDCTGKSTLARHLALALRMNIQESEGPGKSAEELSDRIERYERMTRTIFVRHPCVSQPIYNEARALATQRPQIDVPLSALRKFYRERPLFIYCAPPPHSLPLTHVVKDHDTPEHLAILKSHEVTILQLYQKWASDFARLHYCIGDNKFLLTRMVSGVIDPFDPVQDVEDFHRAMHINYVGKPRALDGELLSFRLRFLREETAEYETAASEARYEPHIAKAAHRANALDALVDLVYVALGTAHLHGFPFREAWRRVHAANMLKRPTDSAADYDSRVRMRIMKPEGWQPPNHLDLV